MRNDDKTIYKSKPLKKDVNGNDPIDETIKAYRGYADYYLNRHVEWDEVLPFKVVFEELLEKNSLILDVGFGSVRDMRYFREHGFRVVGIDLCDEFLEEAKKEGFEVYKMDMRDLKFEDEKFDGLWVAGSFHHIPSNEAKKVVEGFYRVLKPGGILFISVKEGKGEGFIVKDVYKTGTKMWYLFYTEEKLLEMFSKFRPIFITKDRRRSQWIAVVFRKPSNDEIH